MTGNPVDTDPVHLGVTGITREAGKTTLMEGMAKRSGRTTLVLRTKLGEGDNTFQDAHPLPLFFKSNTDWQYVESLLAATTREDQRFNRAFIRYVCRNTNNDLNKVWDNVRKELAKQKQGSWLWSIYYNLDGYFEIVIPNLANLALSHKLELEEDTINLMDLEPIHQNLPRDKAEALQALLIRAVLDEVFSHHPNTTVILPEAGTFLAAGRVVTPVHAGAEAIVRQGAVRKIYLWLDSQDIVGIVTAVRGQISTWILGKQAGGNDAEVQRSLELLERKDTPKDKIPTASDIKTLELGQFYFVKGKEVRKIYAQPAWLPDYEAQRVAKGEMNLKDVERFYHGYLSAAPIKRLADITPGTSHRYPSRAETVEVVVPPPPASAYDQPRKTIEMVDQGAAVDRLAKMLQEHDLVHHEDIKRRLKLLEEQIRLPRIGEPHGNNTIDNGEELWRIKNSEPKEHHLTTGNRHGKVLYALINDLHGGPTDSGEVMKAALEHGWAIEQRFVDLELHAAAREGQVVRDPDKRWRTPKKVRLIVEEVKA